jgi:hypothetical protein
MQSLLGRIVAIESDDTRHKITFEPLCTLPDRKAPPEHLKNQKLTFERHVADVASHGEGIFHKAFTSDTREIGKTGDSIVLTVGESLKFLHPLKFGNGTLLLFWWQDDNPPDWTAKANGQTRTGKWVRDESRLLWDAMLSGADFGLPTQTKFSMEATCGPVKAHHAFWDQFNNTSSVGKFETTHGAESNLQNRFMSVHAVTNNGGAIREIFRSGPTFLSSYGFIHHPLDWGGHTDRFRTGWDEWKEMRDVKMEVVGAAREANTSRVTMQGEIEEGLRTQFSATLLDDWPLLLMRREFSLHPKKDEKKDDEELKQPIDAMRLFQTGFRCAVAPDKAASRVWCRADGESVPFSLARENEHQSFWHWKMEEGFALFEQEQRREWLMYFFDPDNAPHLGLWRGPHAVTLEPFWAGVPLKPGESTGFSLGLAAGESGGANGMGAWVACRAKQDNQWHCALLARCFSPEAKVIFQIGEQTQRVPVMPLFLPGIGTIHGASASFELNDKSDAFEVHLEGGA